MRFPQLRPGQRFRWNGQVFSKSGPVTAVAESDGSTRMIPRSARLEPVAETTAEQPAPAGKPLDPAEVEAALDALAQRVEGAASGLGLTAEQAKALHEAITSARRALREQLGL